MAHSKDNEPETLSYYFFTNTASDDHTIYGFEAYPTKDALTEIHSKSGPFTRQSAILAEEKLCTVDVPMFRPVSGFIVREGAVEKPAELIVIKTLAGGDAAKARLAKLVEHVAESEGADTPTFLVMEELETGELWTFERYASRSFYEQTHSKSAAFAAAFGGENKPSSVTEYAEANVGFLSK